MNEIKPKYIEIEVIIKGDTELEYTGLFHDYYNIETGKFNTFTDTVNVWDKVSDTGTYRLLDENKNIIKVLEQEYVPNACIPGEYGDYIDLKIVNGILVNRIKNPDFYEFYEN